MTKIQKQCLFLILGIASAKIRFPRQLQEKGTISIKNLGTVINLFVNLTLTFLGIIGVRICYQATLAPNHLQEHTQWASLVRGTSTGRLY